MHTKVVILLMFLSTACFGQTDTADIGPRPKAWVSLRIHPLRFLYGLNGGIDVRLSEHSAIGFTYVNHLRDFLSPLNTSELELAEGRGSTMVVQLYLERKQVVFHGPRIAVKDITFPTSEYIDSETEEPYSLWRDQQNWYGSYSVGLRRVDRGFYIMSSATLGAVWMRAKEFDTRQGAVEEVSRIYPHFLIEVGLGWSF